jgi:hypothetical protein
VIADFDGHASGPSTITAQELLEIMEGIKPVKPIVGVAANAKSISFISKNWPTPANPSIFHLSPQWVVDERVPHGQIVVFRTHEAMHQYVADMEAGKPHNL